MADVIMADLDRGAYDKIVVDGEFTHRGAEEDERPLTDDISNGAKYYGQEVKETVGQVVEAAKKVGQAFTDAVRDATKR